MKKLLSLLSVLTISGTVIPTTIAASPYPRQTQENKLENSEINNKQTDNKAISPQLQNNNYSWLDTVSALWEIGIKKAEYFKDYIAEKYENIKNGLENLSINDLLKLFENKEQYNNDLFNKKRNFLLNKTNLMKTVGWRKIINVSPIEQETDWYCAPAVTQMILNYFNVNINDFSQNRIYSDLGGVGEEGLITELNWVNYVNNLIQQHGQSRGLMYYYHPLESGFGSIQTELLMFEFYVTQSLSWNAPIAFGYDQGRDEQHIILFTGIEINQEDPANTIYHYIDPSYGTNETMYGRDIENYCIEGAELLGVGNSFDFKNKQIEFDVTYTPEEHKESGTITMNSLNMNLTQNIGITSINQLHNFSDFKIEDYKMRAVWNGWVDEQYSTNYNTKQIPLGQTDWILAKKNHWYFWFAHAFFEWYWETTTFYKVDEFDRSINDLF